MSGTAGFSAGFTPGRRLIAATQDMLRALRLAEPIIADELRILENSFLPEPNPDESEELTACRIALTAIRAAIAKAEGTA